MKAYLECIIKTQAQHSSVLSISELCVKSSMLSVISNYVHVRVGCSIHACLFTVLLFSCLILIEDFDLSSLFPLVTVVFHLTRLGTVGNSLS